MPTENLQVLYSASADFASEAWEVLPVYPGRPLRQGSLQVIWSGLNSLDGELEVEISNDNINWNCYGGGVGITMDTANDSQIFEFTHFNSRYVRLSYYKNSVTTGTIIVRTHGATW